MKYLKLFNSESDYNSYKDGSDFILPNVSYVEDINVVYYNAYIEPTVDVPTIANNVIMYTASAKLNHITDESRLIEGTGSRGLAVDVFNPVYDEEMGEYTSHANIISHEFNDGVGIITFDEDITMVGQHAFVGCGEMTSIVLPATLTYLQCTFPGAYNLESIICHATGAPGVSYFYEDMYLNEETNENMPIIPGTLYCPKGSDYSLWMNRQYGSSNFGLASLGWTIKYF